MRRRGQWRQEKLSFGVVSRMAMHKCIVLVHDVLGLGGIRNHTPSWLASTGESTGTLSSAIVVTIRWQMGEHV